MPTGTWSCRGRDDVGKSPAEIDSSAGPELDRVLGPPRTPRNPSHFSLYAQPPGRLPGGGTASVDRASATSIGPVDARTVSTVRCRSADRAPGLSAGEAAASWSCSALLAVATRSQQLRESGEQQPGCRMAWWRRTGRHRVTKACRLVTLTNLTMGPAHVGARRQIRTKTLQPPPSPRGMPSTRRSCNRRVAVYPLPTLSSNRVAERRPILRSSDHAIFMMLLLGATVAQYHAASPRAHGALPVPDGVAASASAT